LLKVFIKGIIFGLGFLLTIFVCLSIYTSWVLEHPADLANPLSTAGWHDTSPENKIATSSIIVVVKFENGSTGDLKPIVNEFIKRDKSIPFYYEVGDFYQPLSKAFYENAQEGKKIVLLFVGSQNMTTMSVTNDTVGGLNQMPLSMLRELANDA
jgi:hypothetical protein